MKQCNQEALDWYCQQQHMEEKLLEEERMILLENLLHFLPPVRQKIMTLYYLQAVPAKRIAALLHLSSGRVSYEMHQALDFLQKVTHALDKPLQKRRTPVACTNPILPARQLVQQQIFQLRHEHKLSFTGIAGKINHSAVFVHQCYVAEHARLHQMRQTG